MLGRDLLAVGFLGWMPQPVLNVRHEPLGRSEIPHGMIIVLRVTASEDSVGHSAIKQNCSHLIIFCKLIGDRSQHPVRLAPDLTETPVH